MQVLFTRDAIAHGQGLKMIEFLYQDFSFSWGGIEAVPEDACGNSHQWKFDVSWEGDSEPTWYTLRLWAGDNYNVWTLHQDTHDDMLLSVKQRIK